MKRTLSLVIMAAALLLMQCKKPSIEFPTPSVTTTVSMTITAGPGSKTDITTEGGIVWSENDKIYVGDGDEYIGYLEIQSGVGNPTGTFTGDVTATTGNGKTFHFYYLGNAKDYSADLASNNKSVVVDFSNQNIYEENGKLKNASGQHVGYGKVEGVDVEADKPITGIQVDMKSKVAIAYFCFQDGERANPYTGALTLSGEHIYNKMTVKFNESDFSFNGTSGDISLTNTTTHLKYAMLVPTGSTAEETLNFGGGATGSTTLANGIEANKFYRIDGSMPIVVPLAHGMVNFGAPNLNWSVCNLGATNGATAESWYGDYYAWGETAPYYQNGSWCEHPSHDSNINFDQTVGYGWKNYLDGSSESWDEDKDWKPIGTTLTSDYDAATAAWGDGWRMPTSAEWQSLYANNTFEWLEPGESDETYGTGFKAVAAGYFVVKGKGASIDSEVYMFLPAAGYFDGTSLNDAGSDDTYWSSSSYTDDTGRARYIYLSKVIVYPEYYSYRYCGMSVRPVRAAR